MNWSAMKTAQAAITACALHAAVICADGLSLSETTFNAVDGDSGELMIAVGDHGAIVHITEGARSTRVDSPTTADLLDVHVGSRNFAVTVGEGVVLLWDGVHWRQLVERAFDTSISHAWASPDELLVIYTNGEDGRQACPWIPDAMRQPFCRTFKAPVLGACGDHKTVYLVLANGDIHRVNDALQGKDGHFAAVYANDQALELKSAWLPKRGCEGLEELPRVYAVDVEGDLMQFDGQGWKIMDAASLAVAMVPIQR